MPKCDKYHAKWKANMAKYKANGTGKESPKKIQNLRQKTTKTILHPLFPGKVLSILKLPLLCLHQWPIRVPKMEVLPDIPYLRHFPTWGSFHLVAGKKITLMIASPGSVGYTHYHCGITPRMNLPGPDIPIKPQPFVEFCGWYSYWNFRICSTL